MTTTKIRKGTLFLHRNMPDPYWRPSRGETEEDRPTAIMKITSVRKNLVYFTYIDVMFNEKFSMSLDNWLKFYHGTPQILKN